MKKTASRIAVAMFALALLFVPQAAFAEEPPTTGQGTASQQALEGLNSVNPNGANSPELTTVIQTILNAVYFIIGIVAVVMIILGGISYATSQGDPAKVKKGKDTILYGIVGLIISLMAFAITQFILNAMNG